jgi:hypothetical protein
MALKRSSDGLSEKLPGKLLGGFLANKACSAGTGTPWLRDHGLTTPRCSL